MKRQLLLLAAGFLVGSTPAWADDGKFEVLFPLGKATLDSTAHETIAAAKQEFDRTGSAHVTIVGHTDTSGSTEFNQRLSERRAQVITDALVGLGVPQADISSSGVGETDLAVQTGPNVKEARNRRTEIDIAAPPAPPPAPAPTPAPVAAAPAPAAPPPEEKRWTLTAGGFYGYSFKDNHGGHSQLGGINLGLDYKLTSWMTIGIEQAGFYHFDSHNDGFGGRTVVGPDFYFGNLLAQDWPVAPYIGANVGYLYGAGIADSGIAGPEIGLKAGMFDMKVAYDMPFNRNPDQGIINTTIGVSFDF
ncbi:MAG TPA: OmpA family protein [Terriglobales bacterium]|nr:OmpA family protein [Terriglobales bacterium]